MSPDQYTNAWQHPETRKAWHLHMVMTVLRLTGWVAACVAALAVYVVFLSSGFAPLLVAFLGYGAYRAVLQVGCLTWSVNIKRVLEQYPWQLFHGLPRGRSKHPDAGEDEMWYEIPNPENPGEGVPLLFLANMRLLWWVRRFGTAKTQQELKAEIEPLWFAGDPRFYAVIAAPGRGGRRPKRLHFLYQRSARWDTRHPTSDWGAGAEALEQARRAGARTPDPVAPPQQ
ncbi:MULTISPECIES: hypothetical protein [unclassified Streptomyces]|uniref:hypothetical protein n=1 Tax=unclassified Streptomyces TaxID=2593676 RepID=UPI0033E23DE2